MNPRLIALLTKLQKGQTLTDSELRLLTELDCEQRAADTDDVEVRCDNVLARLEVRAADSKHVVGTIHGRPANYGVLSKPMGGFAERIKPGCFTDSLAATDDAHDVRALVAHDKSKVLGRRSAGTLEVRDDAKGLDVDIHPLPTTLGKDTFMDVEARNLDQMSFGFRAIKTAWGRDTGGIVVRELVKADLKEVSVVAWAQYPHTQLSTREEIERATLVGGGGDVSMLRMKHRQLERRYYDSSSSVAPSYSGVRSDAEQATYIAQDATRKARTGNKDDAAEAARLHDRAAKLHKQAAKMAPVHHDAVADEHCALCKMHKKDAA